MKNPLTDEAWEIIFNFICVAGFIVGAILVIGVVRDYLTWGPTKWK